MTTEYVMRYLHQLAFSLLYWYLQRLQDNHAIDIGPALDGLDDIRRTVVGSNT